MSRYKMNDGTIVDTDYAAREWREGTRHNGTSWVSLATGDQWTHERLYRSRRGRYYLVRWSDWQGSASSARYVDPREAAAWLMLNGHDDMPSDLARAVEAVAE
jgi:hypothetical protein